MAELCKERIHSSALVALGSAIKSERPITDVSQSFHSELRTLILKRETHLPAVSWVFEAMEIDDD
jgi:hypothetical protein